MADTTNLRGYGIGEVSRRTGVHIETIRYYERIDVLPRPDRTPGGNRQYSHDQLKRLHFVKKSRDLGFSLQEIRALLDMVDRNDFSCAEIHRLTIAHQGVVRQKLDDLKRLDSVLTTMASQCSKGDVPECPIVDTLFELPA